MKIYKDSVYPLFIKIRDTCSQLLNLNEKTMYSASIKAEQVATHAIWSTLFVALFAFIIALSFSLLISENIIRPVRRLIDASKILSLGNYNILVPVETIDEIGTLAQEFNQMASQLKDYNEMTINKEVERMKSEFIMALSHELRTPLTSMGMSVDLLMEHAIGSLPEKDQELLKVTQEEIDRMKALVNDLL
ncbi:two-component sensor kinase, partial [Candidatus Magnetoovum chiemensis]